MTELIAARLRRRVRTAGSDPLLTYYDLASDERTELSGVTFGNWVDKTSNLLVDELLLDPGARVELAIAETHPGHWVTLVWAMAGWQVGAVVTLGQPDAADLVVCGPDWAAYSGTDPLVACSLHPLGLGFAQRLPASVTDYALEVRGQPDSYAPTPPSSLAPAWLDGQRRLTQADLVDRPVPAARRTLVRPSEAWPTVLQGLVQPVLGGGSVVIVTGDDETAVDRIRNQERVDDPAT